MSTRMLCFTKMHGLGNDFVVIDARHAPIPWSKAHIQKLANRHTGIGFDQLLVLEQSSSPDIDYFYRIFNADGGEVGQCGNGARCLARYIIEHKLSEKQAVVVQTQTSILTLHLKHDSRGFGVVFPKADFSPEKTGKLLPNKNPITLEILPGVQTQFYTAWVGNPHVICISEHLESSPVHELGRAFNQSAYFPAGINVSFLKQYNDKRMQLRVYERGVGETMACGSAAIACAAIGHAYLGMDAIVQVELPGGELHIDCAYSDNHILMTGPAETVYEGKLALCVS